MIVAKPRTATIAIAIAALSVASDWGALHASDLRATLEPFREKHRFPALAAAVILHGKTAAWGVTGVRKFGTDVRAGRDDQFHIGSCTKAMTATLIAILVEKGRLRWDTTLAEAFPELEEDMQPAYKPVTVTHLLAHRAGLAKRSWPKGKSFLAMHRLPGSPRAQRYAFAKMRLQEAPDAEPGTKFIYANAGYGIAGAVAERVMDAEWEDLMRQEIFDPLGMTTAGFGAMGTPGKIDQPWQHKLVNGKCRAIGPGPLSDNPAVIGPGGTMHCSIADWAKFVAAHLDRGRGPGSLLKLNSLQVLHTPPLGGGYALGWGVTERKWANGKVLTHSGCNTMNYAVVWMAPLRDFAVLVATNQAGGKTAKGCDEVAWTLIQAFLLGR